MWRKILALQSYVFFTVMVGVLSCQHKTPGFHAKRKHIHVKYPFINDVEDSKSIGLVIVDHPHNLVDPFTKGLKVE